MCLRPHLSQQDLDEKYRVAALYILFFLGGRGGGGTRMREAGKQVGVLPISMIFCLLLYGMAASFRQHDLVPAILERS